MSNPTDPLAHLSIRQSTPEDAPALWEYLRGLLSEPGLFIPLLPEEFDTTPDALAQRIKTERDALFLSAWHEQQVVGELSLQGPPRKAFQHWRELGMSVHRDYRGQGVGAALVREALNWARRHPGLKRIQLHVFAANAPAIRLYQRFGFEVEGRHPNLIFKDGAYWDDLTMALTLDPEDS